MDVEAAGAQFQHLLVGLDVVLIDFLEVAGTDCPEACLAAPPALGSGHVQPDSVEFFDCFECVFVAKH